MTPLRPDETELTGHWRVVAGNTIADETCERIQQLVRERLVKIATDTSGWQTLYRDPRDSRLWELTYPQGAMQGGGPPKLTCVSVQRAKAVYGQALG
jgi:hypothetical protein